MSNNEMWFWLGIACVAGLTICSVFKSVFYYKYEAKRKIELAKVAPKLLAESEQTNDQL